MYETILFSCSSLWESHIFQRVFGGVFQLKNSFYLELEELALLQFVIFVCKLLRLMRENRKFQNLNQISSFSLALYKRSNLKI